jgi:hypothetical protein
MGSGATKLNLNELDCKYAAATVQGRRQYNEGKQIILSIYFLFIFLFCFVLFI